MATFKLCIADPKEGKTYKKEVKDDEAKPFLGLNIGETLKGETLGLTGYELAITGGSDYCGFPMRRGILGTRKILSLYGGVGFKGADKGVRKRKTVCGHKINEKISQINLTVSKAGSKSLASLFGSDAAEGGEAAEKKSDEKKE